MIKIKNTETGQVESCTGLFTNPVYNPRVVYSFPDLCGHGIMDLEPYAIEHKGFVYDQYNQYWKTWVIRKPWVLIH